MLHHKLRGAGIEAFPTLSLPAAYKITNLQGAFTVSESDRPIKTP